jgi:hypothetical protein
MRAALLAAGILGAGILSAFGNTGSAMAAVTQDQFPPKTTRDLIAICTAAKDDPLMVAAVNFCQGFAEGVVEVGEAYATTVPAARKPFCLPTPAPTQDAALAAFTTWANADPTRLDQSAVVGLLRFVTTAYPCPKVAPARPTRAHGSR